MMWNLNFWVGIENVTIADLDNNEDPYFSFQWAVSQAAPARRLNVERTAVFDGWYGYASGGFVADSYFAKAAGSYAQQQYYYRNCYVAGGTYGVNWNQVIQGCLFLCCVGLILLSEGISHNLKWIRAG